MALLDQLLQELLRQSGAQQPQAQPRFQPQQSAPQQGGGGGLTQAQLIALVTAAIGLLNDPRIGGIDGLMRKFQQSGLGDLIGSWVGTGQNAPIETTQLERTLPNELKEISRQAGLPEQESESILAKILPQLIDQLTPGGKVPPQDQLGTLGSELLKSLFR